MTFNSDKAQGMRLRRMARNTRALADALHGAEARWKRKFNELEASSVDDSRTRVERRQEPRRERRGRAAVVGWDLGHNPAGRAWVLYQLLQQDWEVDLVGPMWSRYGKDLWQPLREEGLNVRGFRCQTLDDFVPQAELLGAGRSYDLIYVSKPRLPALYMAALMKEMHGCPVIVDVDDFELSFFKDESYADFEELQRDVDAALHEPFEELATRYAQSLVSGADAITVSNVALEQRFGGTVIRHARDELTAVQAMEMRAAMRERLGIAPQEFALMFIGTPRPHKGVLDVARALHEIGDDRIVFHIVGDITDAAFKARFDEFPRARVVFHPNCAFAELPRLLSAADLVPLVQDVNHPISQYQIPAKISDALALGIPVIATETPPLRDLIAQRAVIPTCQATLCDDILNLREARELAVQHGDRERRLFRQELGMTINRARLKNVIAEAQECAEARRIDCNDTLDPAWQQMLATVRDAYMRQRKDKVSGILEAHDATDSRPTQTQVSQPRPSRIGRRVNRFFGGGQEQYDIAFFWKQNDSGLYGRRSDMVVRHLMRSGRVRQMLHFDLPMSIHVLDSEFNNPARTPSDHAFRTMRQAFDRQAGLLDQGGLQCFTEIQSAHARPGTLLGQPLGRRDQFARYVRDRLHDAGMNPETTLAWFCPVVPNAHELIDSIGFRGVISDLIDDQRAWRNSADNIRKLNEAYRNTLSRSDLIFANCLPLAETMAGFGGPIHVVPNGAENHTRRNANAVAPELEAIPGPRIGYVGNMRDRIDWILLHEVVQAAPDLQFVFVGPTDNNPNADSLAAYPNVHFVGVVEYRELPGWFAGFDVGLVPHLNNQLTERMNPLKVYNYFAAGLPVVSTEVSNLGELGQYLYQASDAQRFAAAIRDALANPPDVNSRHWQRLMNEISWDSRVESILHEMDRTFSRRFARTAA